MGCFNVTGCVSRLPIHEGDECVLFLCAADATNMIGSLIDVQSTFNLSVAPIFPAIYGKYNEYGSITDIVENEVTRSLEDIFGKPIGDIVNMTPYNYTEFVETVLLNPEDVIFYVALEHKSYYERILSLHKFYDFEKSYEISKDNTDKINDELMYILLFVRKEVYIHIFRNDNLLNMNPNSRTGMFEKYKEPWTDEFAMLFRLYRNVWLEPGIKNAYIDLAKFWFTLHMFNLEFVPTRYAGQNNDTEIYLTLNETAREILDKHKKNEE